MNFFELFQLNQLIEITTRSRKIEYLKFRHRNCTASIIYHQLFATFCIVYSEEDPPTALADLVLEYIYRQGNRPLTTINILLGNRIYTQQTAAGTRKYTWNSYTNQWHFESFIPYLTYTTVESETDSEYFTPEEVQRYTDFPFGQRAVPNTDEVVIPGPSSSEPSLPEYLD